MSELPWLPCIAKKPQRVHTGVVLADHFLKTGQALVQPQLTRFLIRAFKRAGYAEIVKKHLNQRTDSVGCRGEVASQKGRNLVKLPGNALRAPSRCHKQRKCRRERAGSEGLNVNHRALFRVFASLKNFAVTAERYHLPAPFMCAPQQAAEHNLMLLGVQFLIVPAGPRADPTVKAVFDHFHGWIQAGRTAIQDNMRGQKT